VFRKASFFELTHDTLHHRLFAAVRCREQEEELLGACIVRERPQMFAGAARKQYNLHNKVILNRKNSEFFGNSRQSVTEKRPTARLVHIGRFLFRQDPKISFYFMAL
jgi:hypothetical protein